MCAQQSLTTAVDKFHIIHLIPHQVQVSCPHGREGGEIAASFQYTAIAKCWERRQGGAVTNYT